MQITLERDALLASLGAVARVVERRTTIPILSNVLLKSEAAHLRITATDLDIQADTQINLDALDHAVGSFTVPAATLHDIVKKLNAGAQVSISRPDDATVLVKSGRSRFTVQALPASDFPDLAAGEMSHRFTLPGQVLAEMLDEVQFAISTEETRYYLNGIYLHQLEGEDGPKLRMVATDGHRLSRREIAAPEGAIGMPGIIIPRKMVGEVRKLADFKGDLAFELSKAKLQVSAGATVFISKLIDGTFPDYQRVIPASNSKRATLETKAFAAALDRVATISGERGRAVKCAFADGKLTLSVRNPDAGDAIEEVDCDYDDPPIEVGFNARYLADILGALGGDTVLMKLEDPGSPTVLTRSEGSPLVTVLMPMRV